MTDIDQFIVPEDLDLIRPEEKLWLKSIFKRLNGYPNLEQIWMIMNSLRLRSFIILWKFWIDISEAFANWILFSIFIRHTTSWTKFS